jgi:hypothetical protein
MALFYLNNRVNPDADLNLFPALMNVLAADFNALQKAISKSIGLL